MKILLPITFFVFFLLSPVNAYTQYSPDCWNKHMVEQMSVCSKASLECNQRCTSVKDSGVRKACFDECSAAADTCRSKASADYKACIGASRQGSQTLSPQPTQSATTQPVTPQPVESQPPQTAASPSPNTEQLKTGLPSTITGWLEYLKKLQEVDMGVSVFFKNLMMAAGSDHSFCDAANCDIALEATQRKAKLTEQEVISKPQSIKTNETNPYQLQEQTGDVNISDYDKSKGFIMVTGKDGVIFYTFLGLEDDIGGFEVSPNTKINLPPNPFQGAKHNPNQAPGQLPTKVELEFGEAEFFIIGSAEKPTIRPTFTVATPNVVAGVRGTHFWVAYDKDNKLSTVGVYKGEVEVNTKGGQTTVVAPEGDKPGLVLVSQKLSVAKLAILGVVLAAIIGGVTLLFKRKFSKEFIKKKSRKFPYRFGNQKGIAYIAVVLLVLLAVVSAVWFFTSKQGLKLPQPSQKSTQDKTASIKPKPFKDISADNKNYNAIKYLAREGILEADDNGNFNSESILTRSEWAMMLIKLSGANPDKETYKDCFADISGHQHEAEICYAKDQSWLKEDSEKQSYRHFRLIKQANAQQTKTNFNPDQPVKDAEAVGSLSRLMEWEPGETLTDEKAQNLAKEKNILNAKASTLTKGEAVETMYRAVATVPFGQEKYNPAIDEAVNRQRVSNLMDSLTVSGRETQAREEWARVRNSAIKNFAEGSGIGYKAATEIVDSSQTRDEALKKVREYRYDQWLTKRTSDGKTLEQADIFKAAQQFVNARGGQQQLALDDVSLSKKSDPEADKLDTSDTTFSEGQSISMIIPLDKDYQMLTLDQRKGGEKVKYMLDISAGDMFLWDDQNQGFVFAEVINIETGVIEEANYSKDDNFKSIDKMLVEAVDKIESRLGHKIATPAKSETKPDKKESKGDAQTKPDCRKIFDKETYKCLTDFNTCQEICFKEAEKPDGTTYFNSGEIYPKCMKANQCHEKSSACGDQALEDYRACVRSSREP